MIDASRLQKLSGSSSLASPSPRRALAASTRPIHRVPRPVLAYSSPTEMSAISIYKSLGKAISRVSPSSSSQPLVWAKPVVDVPPPHLYIANAESRLFVQADYRSSLEASIWMNLAVSSTPVPQASKKTNSALPTPRYIKMPDGGNIVVSPSVGSVPPSQIASAMLGYGQVKLSASSTSAPKEAKSLQTAA